MAAIGSYGVTNGFESSDIDTLAKLNTVVTDATLDDDGDPRDPTAHDITSHEVGTLGVGNFPVNIGGSMVSSLNQHVTAAIVGASTRVEAGSKTWMYGAIDYAGLGTGSLIYSTHADGAMKYIHTNRTDGVGNVGVGIGAYFAGTTPTMNPVVLGYYDSVGTTWYDLLSVTGNGDLTINQRVNGQEVAHKTLTELTTIAAAATTDTTIQIPQYALVYSVSVRVTTVITAPTTDFTVGTAATADLFSGTGRTVSAAATTTDPCTAGGVIYFNAATAVRLTMNGGNPGDALGRVRVTINYIDVTPPTS